MAYLEAQDPELDRLSPTVMVDEFAATTGARINLHHGGELVDMHASN